MKKSVTILLSAALLLTSTLPVTASDFQDELDAYLYDNIQMYDNTAHDDAFNDYYPDGYFADNSGVIYLDGGSVTLTPGESKNLDEGRIYHTLDEDYAIYLVGGKSWKSSSPDVVSVDGNGVITAHKAGYARVTVRYNDSYSYRLTQTIRVSVRNGTAATAAAENFFEVVEGKQLQLSELLPHGVISGTTTWSTDSDKTVTVDASGLASARKAGVGIVSVSYRTRDGEVHTDSYSFVVKIAEPLGGRLTMRAAVPQGKTVDYAKFYYPSGTPWHLEGSSSDSTVIRLDGGKGESLKAGKSTVTLKTSSNSEEIETRSISVTVV